MEGSKGVITDDEKFLSTGGGGSNIVTDLETKTQNISLSATTPTQTVMTADLKLGEGTDKNLECGHIAAYSETCETKVEFPTFRVSAATGGLVGYGGNERVIADYDNSKLKLDSLASNGTVDISATQGINVNNKVVTTRTTFTDNQELVSKAYVDANAGGDTAALDTKTQNINATDGTTTLTGDVEVSSGSSTTYDNSIVIALGQSNSNTMAYSTDDGASWSYGTSIFNSAGRKAAYGNGKWVAVGGINNTIAHSNDGITWTGLGASIFTNRGYDIVFSDGKFVAVGNGTNTIAHSTDGINWTGLGASIFTSRGTTVYYANGLWLAGGFGTNTMAYSSDGVNWVGLGSSIFTGQCRAFGYGGGLWLAGGYGRNAIASSSDGVNWTGQGTSTTVLNSCSGLAYNGTRWVAVGQDVSSNTPIVYSSDGVNWTGVVNSGTLLSVDCDVKWTGSSFLATGQMPSGSGTVATSSDGVTWSSNSPGLFGIGNGFGVKTSVVFLGSVTISDGSIWTSGDLVVGATAEQTTYTAHNGNQYADGSSTSSFGFSFDVSEPITVTHLMISTNHWDGSGDSTEMKLWTGVNGAGGSTSYNVLSSNIVGDYYELEVSIPLAVGTTYTLSGIPPNSYGGTGITPNPVIQNYNARYVAVNAGTGAIYPVSTWSASNLWGAFGNFKFTKGPPPQRKDVYCSNVYADNIIPSTHDTHSLGTDTNRWNEIHAKTGYFAQQTIYLGDKWKLSVDETHPTASSIKLSHASQGHSSGVIDNEVVLANPTHTGMVVNHTSLAGDTAKTNSTLDQQ